MLSSSSEVSVALPTLQQCSISSFALLFERAFLLVSTLFE